MGRAENTETFTCCLSHTAGISSLPTKQQDRMLLPSLHQRYQVNESCEVLILLDTVKQDLSLTDLLPQRFSAKLVMKLIWSSAATDSPPSKIGTPYPI